MCRLFSTSAKFFQNSVLRAIVPIKEDFVIPVKKTATPQISYDFFKGLFVEGNSNLSSEALWAAGSQQLAIFLHPRGIQVKSHRLKTMAVLYIDDTCVGVPENFLQYWNSLNSAHKNFYNDTETLEYVKKVFAPAASNFCNSFLLIKGKSFESGPFISSVPEFEKKNLMVKRENVWKSQDLWDIIDGQRKRTNK